MNVKRLSKRTLATLLSVLLLLSTIVVGATATVNAEGETSKWSYKNGTGKTQNIYSYLDTTNLSSWSVTKIRMIAVSNDKIYESVTFDSGITGTNLRYKNIYAPVGENWSTIDYIFFADCIDTGKANTYTYDLGEGKTYASIDDFLENKVNKDKNNNYKRTANYSDGLTLSDYNRVIFVPNADGTELKAYNRCGTALNSNSVMDIPQNIKIYTDGEESTTGGSLSIAGNYTMSGTSSVTASNTAISSSGTKLNFSAVHSSKATITATANNGYTFLGIYDGTTKISDENNAYTIDINRMDKNSENINLIAKFASGIPQSVVAGDGGTAFVSGSGSSGTSIGAASGASVTITATANDGYKFDGWYDNSSYTGNPISTNSSYAYTVTGTDEKIYYARFSKKSGGESSTDEGTTPFGKNDKSRKKDATSLSNQAKAYYTDEVKDVDVYNNGESGVYQTFKTLAKAQTNDVSTSYLATQNNSLYTALYNIMKVPHSHGVSYPAYGKNSLANYWLSTDTSDVNEPDGRGVYTFFYSDVDCHNHENMQREHIWPKSKASYYMATGLGGSDLHHLRPAYGRLNNIKSNWGFASIQGESGWKNLRTVNWPDSNAKKQTSLWRADKGNETFIDVKKDVRGDVARILLYVYTRWKQPNLYSDIVDEFDDDGKSKNHLLPDLDSDDDKNTGERIIYDLDTLLDWMKNDPVSEWEMKRNDLTENIQGNRNVFIDYPELAWLLFDKTVPTEMVTPSGMNKTGTTDINKVTTPIYNQPVTLDLKVGKNSSSTGIAKIVAKDNNGNIVKNGSEVERGTPITYTVIPDESTLSHITFNASSDTAVTENDMFSTYTTDSNGNFTFTKKAGYYWDNTNSTDNNSSNNLSTEKIIVFLESKATELIFNAKSMTAGGTNAGGSGSGMITAMYSSGDKKGQVIESGDTVENGSKVALIFTPDYGSRFIKATSANFSGITDSVKKISTITNCESYMVEVTVDSSSSARTKTISAHFAQTFNALDKVTVDGVEEKAHINNKGMRPDEGDAWKDETDFTSNFEICGVQIKKFSEGNENKALRFVSVIDKNILDKAESYGYVIGKSNSSDYQTLNRFAYSLVKDNDTRGVTMDCTDSDNTVFGDYGKHDTTTNYKYITAAVENISDVDTTIIARPYVVLKDEYHKEGTPSVIYGQYVDFSTGDNYCSISTSYNHIYEMANTNKEEE